MRTLRRLFVVVILFSMTTTLYSQTDYKINLRGRFMLDGYSLLNSKDVTTSKIDIADLRLGAKFSFQNWTGKFDIGFSGNKVSLKDAFLQYNIGAHYFRFGNMLAFCGLDQLYSSVDFFFNTGAPIVEIMYLGRKLSLAYMYTERYGAFSLGISCGDKLSLSSNIKPGYTISLRGIGRPINQDDELLHIAFSGLYRIPDIDIATGISNVSLASKGVTSISMPNFQQLSFSNPSFQTQTGFELVYYRNRWMWQSEYMGTLIRQQNGHLFYGQGGYFMTGFLLKGKHYGYDMNDSMPVMPTDPKSLMLVFRYNGMSLDHKKAEVFGGLQHDISIGLNYYFNNYVSTRLNYSWISLNEHSLLGNKNIHLIQTRIQFRF